MFGHTYHSAANLVEDEVNNGSDYCDNVVFPCGATAAADRAARNSGILTAVRQAFPGWASLHGFS